MRLKAQLAVTDRNVPIPHTPKFATGCLSIGSKNLTDKDPYLLVCTVANRVGNMYRMNRNNIERVFGKFICEGKCTFRFREPPHDVSVRGERSALENFVRTFGMTISGSNDPNKKPVRLPLLTPATPSDVSRPKEKLLILKKKDYPFSKGFPSTLKHLVINGINLQRVDSRILKLRHLVNLNLDSCSLTLIPPMWDRLIHMASLQLSNNRLDSLPPEFCQGSLCKSLQVLDLRFNKFKKLPRYICNLETMHTIKVDNNELFEFPPSIGKMSNLKYLSAANNRMAYFPGSAFFMRVDFLDLSGNFMDWDPHMILPKPPDIDSVFPSLKLICARTILVSFSNLPTPELVPFSLVEYLKSLQKCLCGIYATEEFTGYGRMGVPEIASTYRIDSSDSVLGRFYMCTPDCQNMFNAIPHVA